MALPAYQHIASSMRRLDLFRHIESKRLAGMLGCLAPTTIKPERIDIPTDARSFQLRKYGIRGMQISVKIKSWLRTVLGKAAARNCTAFSGPSSFFGAPTQLLSLEIS